VETIALQLGEYAPVQVPCPSIAPTIRTPNGLSIQETAWLQKRRQHIKKPMRDLLHRINIPQFNSDAYMDKVQNGANLPTIGIAMSGGGYRALLVGAGAVAAFDDRTTGSKNQLGGLLQSSTYVSGLSGGGWLVGSLFVNNFTSVEKIISNGEASKIWHFRHSLIEGPPESDTPGISALEYWRLIYSQVKGKQDAGFDSSLTDYWARGLSFQMLNAVDGGPGNAFKVIPSIEKLTIHRVYLVFYCRPGWILKWRGTCSNLGRMSES
jgi:lysophospholipase